MAQKRKCPAQVAVIGLGKLGSPMAAAIASRGVAVIGVDVDPVKVDRINRGEPPVPETNLAETIRRGRARLRATTDIVAAVAEADIVFVIVPTPSEPHGGFSLRHLLPACEQIGRALKKKKQFTVVAITSTVMPGSTGGPIRECLEKNSGKSAGKGFGLIYSPEFIALGSVIHDFLNPDFILVGESDPASGEILDAFYQQVCENQPHVARMNYVNAELSKLAVNTFITTKITYANMLAHVCQQLPGADVDVVTAAIGRDTRIGGKYLHGATGYGGPCFPRDNLAMGALARGLGEQAPLPEATDRENRAEVRRLAALVKRHARPGARVGVLGLAYKPDTDVIEESQGVMLVQALLADDYEVMVYDPMAMDSARVLLGDQPVYCASAEDCLRQSDIAVLVVPWKEFARLPEKTLGRRARKLVLIDAWRMAQDSLRRKTTYIPVGVCASPKGK
jgi:UDPglucose 6-dehydrogenase